MFTTRHRQEIKATRKDICCSIQQQNPSCAQAHQQACRCSCEAVALLQADMPVTPSVCSCCHRGFCWLLLLLLVLLGCLSALLLWLLLALRLQEQEYIGTGSQIKPSRVSTDTTPAYTSCTQLQLEMLHSSSPRLFAGRQGTTSRTKHQHATGDLEAVTHLKAAPLLLLQQRRVHSASPSSLCPPAGLFCTSSTAQAGCGSGQRCYQWQL